MVVNVNVALSDTTHELLEKLKAAKGFKNNSETIEFAIQTVAKEVQP